MMLMMNDIIDYISKDEQYRLLWTDNKKGYFIKLFTNKIIIIIKDICDVINEIDDEIAVLENDDPLCRIVNEDKLDEKNKALLCQANNIVEYICSISSEPDCFLRGNRRRLILNAKERFGISEKTIYKYLRKYWQGGKLKYSILPDFYKCGAKGIDRISKNKLGRINDYTYDTGEQAGMPIDEEIKNIFNIAYSTYSSKRKSIPKIYECMIDKYFKESDVEGNEKVKAVNKIPSLRQFRYWVSKNKNSEEELIKRIGEKKYLLTKRALNSDSTYETNGPGFRYQVDATIADVYLVSRIDRTSVIGRPVVYIATDVFSRMITGLHVCLEGPSWVGASSVLYNCIEDKVEFCKKFGVDITYDDWPCIGIPKVILADRGELISEDGKRAVKNLNIAFEFAPSGRGDAKGIVEQYFHIINTEIKDWLPGKVKKEYRERGERDYRLDAKLDIVEFTKIMIYAVLKRNKSLMNRYPLSPEMIQDGVNPIPLEVWNWGIKYKSGNLRRVSEEVLRVNLMRNAKATVTESGIRFNKGLYTCEIAEIERWYSKARDKGYWYVDIVYDNRDISNISIIDDKINKYTMCSLKENSSLYELYHNKTYEEIEDYHFSENSRNTKLASDMLQNACDMEDKVQEVIKGAEVKGKGQKIEKVNNVSQERRNENEDYRKGQALSNRDTKSNKIETDNYVADDNCKAGELDLKSNILNYIKKMNEGKQKNE